MFHGSRGSAGKSQTSRSNTVNAIRGLFQLALLISNSLSLYIRGILWQKTTGSNFYGFQIKTNTVEFRLALNL
jgi:hypothetical protein